MTRRRQHRHLPALAVVALAAAACGRAGAESAPGVDLGGVAATAATTAAPSDTTTTTPTTSSPATTTTSTTTSSTTSTTSTTTTSTTTTSTTTLPAPTTTLEPLPDPGLPASNAAFERLAASNAGASMTVVRDGAIVFSRASGTTIDGQPATGDSPMVVASVSKVVTAVALARLVGQGLVDPAAPMSWADLGLSPHPAWADVTIRELLDHRSGMPVARGSWFQQPGDCAAHLPGLIDAPPEGSRGEWRYSNGNYCALGLLVEQVTGIPLAEAAQRLVFDPIGVDGVHLTTTGLQPTDIAHRLPVARLSRLGGAGSFVVSTDDLALMAGTLTADDLALLTWPSVFTDQYGWGHTGTVDGAKACLWIVEGGRTALAATIAGDSVGTGGGVCDIVVAAVTDDLGIGGAGKPDRTPPP